MRLPRTAQEQAHAAAGGLVDAARGYIRARAELAGIAAAVRLFKVSGCPDRSLIYQPQIIAPEPRKLLRACIIPQHLYL